MRVANSTATISVVMATVLAILPPLVDRASAAQSRVLRSVDISSRGTSASGIATDTFAHLELLADDGSPSNALRGEVDHGAEKASFIVHHGIIQFSDGYSIAIERLPGGPADRGLRLSATSPSGATESASISVDPQTHQTTSVNGERFSALLSSSHAVVLLSTALPRLAPLFARENDAPAPSPGHLRIRANSLSLADEGWVACIGAALLLVAAAVAFIIGCGTPEPAEPLACFGASAGLAGAFAVAVDSCDFGNN